MRDASIDVIYTSFSANNSDLSAIKSNINISALLQFNETFNRLKNRICDAVESCRSLYMYIGDKRDKYSKPVASDLMTRNMTDRRNRYAIDKLISDNMPNTRHLPQYYFPMLYMYNVIIVHNSIKSRSLMIQYRKKASSAIIDNTRIDSTIRRVGSNINSAYMRI